VVLNFIIFSTRGKPHKTLPICDCWRRIVGVPCSSFYLQSRALNIVWKLATLMPPSIETLHQVQIYAHNIIKSEFWKFQWLLMEVWMAQYVMKEWNLSPSFLAWRKKQKLKFNFSFSLPISAQESVQILQHRIPVFLPEIVSNLKVIVKSYPYGTLPQISFTCREWKGRCIETTWKTRKLTP
jgi:hypothetical protein